MKLSELKNGETAVIVRLSGHGGFRKRIMEMGFIRGEKVTSVLDSPMHDPVKYNVMGYDVLLRRNEAAMIEVLPEEEAKKELPPAPRCIYVNNYNNDVVEAAATIVGIAALASIIAD